ncbi:MAG: hypothetical protein A3G59_02770 [Candidatus Taylorbacteria bacterium RIFCSPLOWO2_12_FULL_47_20]|uniref:DUF167 domain-containing protein n=2 Tax=Candidatus Tayloriibacteriota TaxID=1817919 RepID=A0A1G2P4L9_9BACT|nr:MAG: hypothetical protein A3H68_00715 [Candidatus Taylorbacteria bacterium RIFCSPLOWO2_02_FULL_46_40]OHA43278.1 MAG: hypothetical protein A3G59_02770 [Candidatus Taylorbacteria bacterium RIFCSPLOWO2_12_FULL_47_20]
MHLKVKVFPSSKIEKINDNGPQGLEVFVREPSTRNLANRRVIEIIGERFGRGCKLVAGHRSFNKIFDISQ